MAHSCNHSCSGCSGCGRSLLITPAEVAFLHKLGQIPFLPVARKASDMIPVYLEDTDYSTEEYSTVIQLLEKKSLIRLDYDGPLTGADMSAYKGYPVQGYISLTARGLSVLEQLELQGVDSEA